MVFWTHRQMHHPSVRKAMFAIHVKTSKPTTNSPCYTTLDTNMIETLAEGVIGTGC